MGKVSKDFAGAENFSVSVNGFLNFYYLFIFYIFLSLLVLSLQSGFCHSPKSADVALFGAMRGPRPVQGAHDGAVRLPQVQLSVQARQQVRRALRWPL